MIALILALAPRVTPGAELGVLYPAGEGPGFRDVVLTSIAQLANPRSAGRAVGMLATDTGELTVQYITTRGDSGNLLASIASQDVVLS
ncbi:MAG TPA: hypothetical protein VGB92_26035 [Longimicrobium sp.]